jgi:hypothetical protein
MVEGYLFGDAPAAEESVTRKNHGSETDGCGILDHDLVVWAGDLNYAMHEDVQPIDAREELTELGRNGGEPIHTQLVAADQLINERSANRAFGGFDEAPLRFRPTYRVIVGEDRYDPKRCPAWTDRVLWRERVAPSELSTADRLSNGSVLPKTSESAVTSVAYSCRWEARLSDHKPVFAVLDVDLAGLSSISTEATGLFYL